ncbi:GFA family protein [Pseudooceanicola sp.]|uniref:GFA family protein n=1 Tax=Pseudooceanicola sp. TaxID=1914328 RepID=UPI002621168F|nr:GFA family protein [Pseudooceanicola sp.]MDF1855069.1 GFA family protein [Pseudooceanicola sp.]
MNERQGGCMCGAVRFTATDVPGEFGACHCEMCRRWTGSAFLGITVPRASVTWQGEAQIRTLQSSDWAERAWCGRCGTGLYYHITADGPMAANYEIPVGILDDANGLTMRSEIYIDQKPDSFAYAGEHQLMTRAEVLAKYGISLDGE